MQAIAAAMFGGRSSVDGSELGEDDSDTGVVETGGGGGADADALGSAESAMGLISN